MQLKIKDSYIADGLVKNIWLSHMILTKPVELFEKGFEIAVVLLSGQISVFFEKEFILERKNVFEEKASALYIPRNTKVLLTPKPSCEVVICKTKVDKNSKFAVIYPNQIKEQIRGKVGYRRKVCDILDEDSPSVKLVLGETINFKGEWSSFPPHKHDQNSDIEAKMEEIYLFKLNPSDGFGMQRIYTQDKAMDETISVETNDIVLIPKGYHPVCVIPGYELYYLWVLVGDTKKLMPNTQEQYRWLIK
jgi:5-deoxy-glucuronate isomerase